MSTWLVLGQITLMGVPGAQPRKILDLGSLALSKSGLKKTIVTTSIHERGQCSLILMLLYIFEPQILGGMIIQAIPPPEILGGYIPLPPHPPVIDAPG